MPVLERDLTLDDLAWAVGQLVEDEASATHRTPAPPFRDFIRDAWPVIEPIHPFVGGYHVDAIVEHLEAVSRGELPNLLVNIPPRHSKSSLITVLWPCWEWISEPALRWLFVSYGQTLSTRDSVKRRRLISSAWYRQWWGDRYRLTGDQNEKTRFENDRTGVMIASSIGGVATGEGGSRFVIDDAHNADEIESEAKRQAVLDWWDGAMSTRADQATGIARVVVGQRLHEQDLPGHILEQMADGAEQFDHLVLPAEYEPRVQVCLAGLDHDQRTEPGQLLSPERFDRAAIERLKVVLRDRAPGQLQQRPAPAGGAIYLVDLWFGEGRNRYHVAEHDADPTKVVARYISVDSAMKKGSERDFTGCVVADLRADYMLRIREVWNEQLEFHELLDAVTRTVRRWDFDGKLQDIVIEDASSGTSAIQTLTHGADARIASLIQPFKPAGSKVYRARQATQAVAQDCVELPHPSADVPWLHDFTEQLRAFPTAAHDDMVDSFGQLIIYLELTLSAGYHARRGVAA